MTEVPESKLKELYLIDKNIEAVRKDKKTYNKEANETIKRLKEQKIKLMDNINQMEMFN